MTDMSRGLIQNFEVMERYYEKPWNTSENNSKGMERHFTALHATKGTAKLSTTKPEK